MRSGLRTFLLLFALALAARVGFGLWSGLGGPPVEDERGYAAIADALADGRGFELPLPPPFEDVAPRTSFRAPLWPLVLAPVAAAGGGLAVFRVVAILLGAFAPPLLWLALRRTSLREFAHWPALAFALWPPAVYVSVRVLSEPLAMALFLAAIAVSPSQGQESGGHRGPPLPVLAGFLLGLAVLARPAALLPALLVAAARRPIRHAALCVGVCLLTLAPWVVRNAVLHGRPLLTTNTGVTLVGGNSEAALAAEFPGKWVAPEIVFGGPYGDLPDLGMWGWHGFSEAESDSIFTDHALAFVRKHPAKAIRLAGHKLVRFVDPDQHSAKGDAGLKRIVGWATAAPAFLLAAIGLARRRRDASLRPFAWLVAGVLATCLVFYADARMRGAADPAILAFAAAAVARRPGSGVHERIG